MTLSDADLATMICTRHASMTAREKAREALMLLYGTADRIDDNDVDEATHLLNDLVAELEAMEGSPRLVWPSAPGGEPVS